MADGQVSNGLGSPPQEHPPAFSTGLYKLRQQIRKDSTTCWLLIGLAALCSYSLGPSLAGIVGGMIAIIPMLFQSDFSNPGSMPDIEAMMMGGSTIVSFFGFLGGGFFSVGVGLGAFFLFKKTKERTIHDLVYGNMALVLIDEQYGFLIEEAVQSKYRLMLGKVHNSGDLAGKVNHLAYYYKYYYRMSFGPSEIQVSTVSAESCWLEGCALVGCYSCPVILVALVLRIILVRPRVLAIKIAVSEFLEGRHDHLLEQQTGHSAH